MRKGLTFLPSLALAAVIAFPGMAESVPTAETVVARVNGEEITVGHLIIARATLPEQYQSLPPNVLFDGILDQLVQQSALSQSYAGEIPNRIKLSLENETRSLLAGEVLEAVMLGAADEAEIRTAYEAKYAGSDSGSEFNASHILVETEEEALSIQKELNAGADFAEMAKAKSTGPSGPSGGELGWFGAGQMVPEFEAAVVALSPGQVSAPVQTQFGWHVIILNDSRPIAAPTLEEAQDEIVDELRRAAVEEHIKALTDAATIERPVIEGLNPDILSNVELLAN